MSRARALMLVSANVDARLRREVADGLRPRPEYLLLESNHGVQLFDWSRLPGSNRVRTGFRSAVHAIAAARELRHYDVVFSDGEHVGIPLALAMRVLGITTPHLVLGHHLTTRAKAPLMRTLGAHTSMSRILVHSAYQRELARTDLGVPATKLEYLPYYADTEFWVPGGADEQPLVVAAGREHRDYATMALACATVNARVFVAAGSVHSPSASTLTPARWPDNFETGFADYRALRELYRRASVVVVPLVNTDFQAGVTTVLEAMAMGKAVVVTRTRGQSAVVQDGVTGISVTPGKAAEMRDAVQHLLAHPAERQRLGATARTAVQEGFGVEAYARRIAGHLHDLAATKVAA